MRIRKELCNLDPIYGNECTSIIKADANEAYYSLLPEEMVFKGSDFNRYPDSDSKELRENIASYYGINTENILMNNGSSHILEMVFNAYCSKGDIVMTYYPGFSMFDNYATKSQAKLYWIETRNDFVQDVDQIIDKAREVDPKIILICNPNNPTGYTNTREEILRVVESFPNKLVVIDEAYSDFSPEVSVLRDINNYDNLLVTKTMSKALGLAGLRIGYIASNVDIIEDLWRVKLPYNISGGTLKIANQVFKNIDKLDMYIEDINREKDFMAEELAKLGFVVYPSGANFLFTEAPYPLLFEDLRDKGILVRQFFVFKKSFVRITMMSHEDNIQIIETIKEVLNEKSSS